MRKIKELRQLPEGTIVCTTDVAALHPNIPHDKGLALLMDVFPSLIFNGLEHYILLLLVICFFFFISFFLMYICIIYLYISLLITSLLVYIS